MNEQQTRDPSLAGETAKSRNRKTVAFTVIEEFEREHSMTDVQVSRLLYQSDTTVSGWRKEAVAPAWVELALDALTRRLTVGKDAPALFLAKVPPGRIQTFTDVVGALGARLTRIDQEV